MFNDYDLAEAKEIAERIQSSDEWIAIMEDCARLCELAGLGQEWSEADGESFEAVVEKAADSLGVELYK